MPPDVASGHLSHAQSGEDYVRVPASYLAEHAAHDENVRNLVSSLARCTELGARCGGVTCEDEAEGAESCTVRAGSEPQFSGYGEVSYTKNRADAAEPVSLSGFYRLLPDRGSGDRGACWLDHEAFEDCCNVVRWGPSGRDSCWEQREGADFEACCVEPLLHGCAKACGEEGRPLVPGVSWRMCSEGWEVRACDVGGPEPELAVYSQWSPSYFMTLAWMLRSLRLAGGPVRLVLRRVWDTRNVSSGDQYSWGPSGYQRQRSVRAEWFQSAVRANWRRPAVLSDTDVEFFPGWLTAVRRCLAGGPDLCVGQQPGWEDDRRDNLNPGFVALWGNERTRRLYETMPSFGNLDGIPRSELFTFNHYLNTHPAAKGGPVWAVFHPEVLLTGLRGMEVRVLRLRMHHAATGSVPHQTKAQAVQRVRASQFRLRKFCPLAGAGRFPAHPVCVPGGDHPRGPGARAEDHRLSAPFVQRDLQRVMMEYNGAMAHWRKDAAFWRLLDAARTAAGAGFPARLCDKDGPCEDDELGPTPTSGGPAAG